jgi:hypothetical protein
MYQKKQEENYSIVGVIKNYGVKDQWTMSP